MFYVNDVSLNFGDRQLLKRVSFILGAKDRAGLIGKNGAGKSTLFKIISGQLSPDAGSIQTPNNFSIGLLKQDLDFDQEQTIIDETRTAFAEVENLKSDLSLLTENISQREDYNSEEYMKLVSQMTEINHRLDLLGAEQIDAKCEKVLQGLGFSQTELHRKIGSFSGGWQMRVELAKLLLTQPDLLLLDEPTNHLDIESIIWLESYLQNYQGIVLIISHDIQFLNNVCNKIIDLELGKTAIYVGNYDKFLVQKEQQREILLAAYQNQQKEIAEKERTITRFMAKASKTSMAQSMQKQLNKLDKIEIPIEENKQLKLSFGEAPRSGRISVKIDNISKSYGQKMVLDGVNIDIERGDKIAFVGQNGMGKTTLAKIIVDELAPSGGKSELGTNVLLSYYAQNQSELLDPKQTVLGFMEQISPPEMRTKIRTILGSFLFSGEDVDKKISVLSGGERARLAMAAMILQPANLIVMDEPTNHLDIYSKEVLKQALLDYDGTLIVVSHDRDFLTGISNKVYEFINHGVKEYLGDINYFLEKKKLDSIREIQTKGQKSETVNASQTIVNHDELRNLKKRLKIVERNIEKLEADISSLESLMMDPSFYQNTDFEEKNTAYKKAKTELEHLMLEWENLADSIVT